MIQSEICNPNENTVELTAKLYKLKLDNIELTQKEFYNLPSIQNLIISLIISDFQLN